MCLEKVKPAKILQLMALKQTNQIENDAIDAEISTFPLIQEKWRLLEHALSFKKAFDTPTTNDFNITQPTASFCYFSHNNKTFNLCI